MSNDVTRIIDPGSAPRSDPGSNPDSDPASGGGDRRALLPLPELPGVTVRDARPGDIRFIDKLQKQHSKAVGWMPTKQLEGHIVRGHVIVAEGTGCGDQGKGSMPKPDPRSPVPDPSASGVPLGYAIGVDRYFKREDTGIIYQMNIAPGSQRGYVGANLLKAMFDRWPYGVRLCCCWCAQDLAANHYWEAMGFVPLAFRTGSRKRDRVHIFWQKKIRAEDANSTGEHASGGVGWWFPSQTGAGAIKEDRIVLPIPPGTHWSDAKPRVLPGIAGWIDEAAAQRKALAPPIDKEARKRERAAVKAARAEAAKRMNTVAAGGLRFGSPKPAKDGAAETKKRSRSEIKNDPRLVAAARELRDRWLEQVAAEPGLLEAATSGAGVGGKYAVARQIGTQTPSALPDAVSDGHSGLLDAA